MCYLLDELMAYEEGFSDIMMPQHTPDCYEAFMGVQDLSSSPTKQDLLVLENHILQQVQSFIPQLWDVPPTGNTCSTASFDPPASATPTAPTFPPRIQPVATSILPSLSLDDPAVCHQFPDPQEFLRPTHLMTFFATGIWGPLKRDCCSH
jgi:hypothetical protein